MVETSARLPAELETECGQLALAIGGAGNDVPDLRPAPSNVAIAPAHGVRATRWFGGWQARPGPPFSAADVPP